MESFSVQSRLTLSTNVNQVLTQLIEGFDKVDSSVKGTQGRLRGLETSMRELGSGKAGLNAILGDFEKLSTLRLGGSLLKDLAQVQDVSAKIAGSYSEMRSAARDTAAAWREIASLSRQANGSQPPSSAVAGGAGSGRDGGGRRRLRDAGGDGSPALFGRDDDYPNAVWQNQDWNAKQREASRRSTAGLRFDSDHAAAQRENEHYGVFGTPEERRNAALENTLIDARERAVRAEKRRAEIAERKAQQEEQAALREARLNAQYEDAERTRVQKGREATWSAHTFGTAEERANAARMNADFDARQRTQEREANKNKLGHYDLLHLGLGGVVAGDAGVGLFERAFMENAEYQHQMALLTGDTRVNDGQRVALQTEIEAVTRGSKVLNRAETLEVFSDLKTVFGDFDEASEMLPTFANFVATLKLGDMKRGGAGDIHQALSAARMMEDQGGAIDPTTGSYNPKRWAEIANAMQRVYFATGGRMSPDSWFAFQKTARSGDMTMNDHALFEETPYYAMSLGPSRFGTALFSDFQVLLAGRMDRKREQWMEDVGAIRKGSGHWQGAGKNKTWVYDPTDLLNRETAKSDVYKWLAETFAPLIEKKYKIDSKTEEGRDEMVLRLTEAGQRGTIAGMWADVIRNYGPAQKEGRNIAAQSSDMLGHLVEKDPMAQLLMFRAAENEFMVTLGELINGPGTAYLKSFTGVLREVVDTIKAHPDGAAKLATYGAEIAVFLKVFGGVAMAAFFMGPFVALLKQLGSVFSLFGAGGRAAAGLAALETGVEGLAAKLGGGAIAGAAAGGGAAAALTGGAVAAGVGGLLYAGAKAGQMGVPFVGPNGEVLGTWGGQDLPKGMNQNPISMVSPAASDRGSASNPSHVIVLNQPSPHDLATGVAAHTANRMNRPPSGYTGADPTIDPLSGFYGLLGP